MRGLLPTLLLLLVLPGTGLGLERHAVPEGTYLIDWRGDFSAAEQDKLRDWLLHMSSAVAGLHGAWPRDPIRIAFKPFSTTGRFGPAEYATGPLPFARILRNAPEGILFHVNADKTLEEFITDWTAYHEFAHLFITYPGRADAWFSEGLASYYQNILQVRAGVLTPQQAIDRYAAAFQRGTDDAAHADLTLRALSADMYRRRAFMRVYWSGALYFLEADLQLRALPEPQSLDAVLRAYGNCCLKDGDERPARDIAADFDRVAGTELFLPLFDRYARTQAMPPYQELLDSDGLRRVLEQPAANATRK